MFLTACLWSEQPMENSATCCYKSYQVNEEFYSSFFHVRLGKIPLKIDSYINELAVINSSLAAIINAYKRVRK